MPVYAYECFECHHQTEHACRIADRPERIDCPNCLGQMRQVIVPTAIQCDDAVNIPWLQEFAKGRKEARFGGRPIQTRAEYRQYLKDHDLRPADGENLSEV